MLDFIIIHLYGTQNQFVERLQSLWPLPLVVVKKKDGSNRMCVALEACKDREPSVIPIPIK